MNRLQAGSLKVGTSVLFDSGVKVLEKVVSVKGHPELVALVWDDGTYSTEYRTAWLEVAGDE